MEVEYIETHKIKKNELNLELYSQSPDEQFKDSVEQHGILTPLFVKEDLTLLSGHKRLWAANELGIEEVPVIIENPYDIENESELLVEYNNQRQKTPEECLAEVKILRRVYENKKIQGRKTDYLAKRIGLGSGRQLERMEYVEKHAPEKIREKMNRQEITVTQAYDQTVAIMKQPVEHQEGIKQKINKGAQVKKAIQHQRVENNAVKPANDFTVDTNERFGAILLCPNWSFEEAGYIGHDKNDWFESAPFMNSHQISGMTLNERGLVHYLDEQACLFLMTPPKLVEQGVDVLRGLGLEHVGTLVWCSEKPMGYEPGGMYNEQTMFFLVGKGQSDFEITDITNWFVDDAKPGYLPERLFKIIEQSCDGPYLNLLARNKMNGWTSL